MRQFVPLTDDEFELLLVSGRIDLIKPYQAAIDCCHREIEASPPLPQAPGYGDWPKVA